MREPGTAEEIVVVQPKSEEDSTQANAPVPESLKSATPEMIQAALMQFCRRFSGLDLLLEARTLVRWGSGEIILDLLQGSCRHNLVWRPPLMIAATLRTGFRTFVAQSEIANERVQVAELRVQMTLTPQHGSKLATTMWSIGGDDFVACRMLIEARVLTGERRFAVRHEGRLEWPREWSG